MIEQPPRPQEKKGEKQLRDTAFWAEPVETLMVSEAPAGAVNLNVDGRTVMGPLQGFGKLWQKTYRVELSGADVTPAEVVKIWKERFPEFQPPQNRFYPSMAGVKPGRCCSSTPRWAACPCTPASGSSTPTTSPSR